MSKTLLPLAGLVASLALVSCDDVQLDPLAPATPASLARLMGPNDMCYLSDDTFNGNPQALLGQVIVVRAHDGVCPRNVNEGPVPVFALEPLSGHKVDGKSILSSPVKRDSQIVTHDGAASVALLSYLSASLDAKTVYSMILFDQASARVDDQDSSWKAAFKSWMDEHTELLQEPDLCNLSVVKGFVQKNIVLRKFTEVSGGAKGGAYGVNVSGKYHTSTDDYSVDIRYGLSLGTMWQRKAVSPGHPSPMPPREEPTPPNAEELEVISTITTIHHEKR
jgi:hypothetical protein